MSDRYPRRARRAFFIPMPPHDLREQMAADGFRIPKVGHPLVSREIKFPLDWGLRPVRSDRSITAIVDPGGVERYHYRTKEEGEKPFIKAVVARANYNHQNDTEKKDSDTGHIRDSKGVYKPFSHPRVNNNPPVQFTTFSVKPISSTRN